METNAAEMMQATLAGRDMVLITVLGAIIRYHPNRDAVLNSMKAAQANMPNAATPTSHPEAAKVFQSSFLNYMKAIRQAERTLPE